MPIESYSFGHMVVDGNTYSKDVLIYPDGSILSPWWRRSGHRLELSDIKEMIRMNPQTIIAGTGASGLMLPAAELKGYLHEHGMEFIALPTAQAVELYNGLVDNGKIGGCFHLTC